MKKKLINKYINLPGADLVVADRCPLHELDLGFNQQHFKAKQTN